MGQNGKNLNYYTTTRNSFLSFEVYFQMYCHSSPVIEWKQSIDFTMRFEKNLNYSGILSNKISMGKKCICNISIMDSCIQEHLEVDN